MTRILQPPAPLDFGAGDFAIFLAGSIDMGGAADWQSIMTQAIVTRAAPSEELVLLNPRRAAWDSTWVQSINNPQFREQVEWELDAQRRASLIAMYFAPATKAPITLLELGLFAHSQKLLVCCPDGFWRKGNVEIVCQRHNIPLTNTLEELVDQTLTRIAQRRTDLP